MPERRPQYEVIGEDATRLVIKDVGPWNLYPTVTNGAEEVVQELAPRLRGRRLFYFDSEGEFDEMFVKDGRFAGFGLGERSSR